MMTYLNTFWARERELMANRSYWFLNVCGFIAGALLPFWVPWWVSVVLIPTLFLGMTSGFLDLEKDYSSASWREDKTPQDYTLETQDSRLFGGLAVALLVLWVGCLFVGTPALLRAFLLGSWVVLTLRWFMWSDINTARTVDRILETVVDLMNTSAQAMANTWGQKPAKVEEPPQAAPVVTPEPEVAEAAEEAQDPPKAADMKDDGSHGIHTTLT